MPALSVAVKVGRNGLFGAGSRGLFTTAGTEDTGNLGSNKWDGNAGVALSTSGGQWFCLRLSVLLESGFVIVARAVSRRNQRAGCTQETRQAASLRVDTAGEQPTKIG
jgi:hypothetical protein